MGLQSVEDVNLTQGHGAVLFLDDHKSPTHIDECHCDDVRLTGELLKVIDTSTVFGLCVYTQPASENDVVYKLQPATSRHIYAAIKAIRTIFNMLLAESLVSGEVISAERLTHHLHFSKSI